MMFDGDARKLIEAEGGAAPLAAVATSLRSADFTVGNLETPLSNRGTVVAGKPRWLVFEGDPRAVQGLVSAGFDAVSLGNNHMLDHGEIALSDTLTTLDRAGIGRAGAGLTETAAWKPAIVTRNGARVAYLAFTDIVPSGFTPSASNPGVAIGTDMQRVAAAIRSAKQQADYVVVSFHWGVEESYTATPQQVADAHAAVDAGADMVLGHHPHLLQGVEFYNGKLIAYSLGNFVFPYYKPVGHYSAILRAALTPSGTTAASVTPVVLDTAGRPKPATGKDAAAILSRAGVTSRSRATIVTIAGGKAQLKPYR